MMNPYPHSLPFPRTTSQILAFFPSPEMSVPDSYSHSSALPRKTDRISFHQTTSNTLLYCCNQVEYFTRTFHVEHYIRVFHAKHFVGVFRITIARVYFVGVYLAGSRKTRHTSFHGLTHLEPLASIFHGQSKDNYCGQRAIEQVKYYNNFLALKHLEGMRNAIAIIFKTKKGLLENATKAWWWYI